MVTLSCSARRWMAASVILFVFLLTLTACGGGGSNPPPPAPQDYAVGGTVSGLAGSGLVLQNNGGDDLAIGSNGAFTFAGKVSDGGAYVVTVLTQPTGLSQTCSVANGSGSIAGADVSNVTVACVTNTFSVGGSVTGLVGSGLVLQNNAGDDLAIDADGAFIFATAITDGEAYAVTVLTQPGNPSQTCSIADGSGTLAGADVSSIQVLCVNVGNASSGTLDTTFGGGSGVVVHANAAGGNGDDSGQAVAVDSNGRIIVAGFSAASGGGSVMSLWRFLADGALDDSFGDFVSGTSGPRRGIATSNISNYDVGNAVAIDASNRIVVVGNTGDAVSDMVVWRYKEDGTLDDTFGDFVSGTTGPRKGFAVHANAAGGGLSDGGSSVAIDTGGRIIIAGSSSNTNADLDLVVWRYKPDGVLDDTFGDFVSGSSGPRKGFAVHNNAAGGNYFDGGLGIVIDGNGRIVISGYSDNDSTYTPDMVVWRYSPDGTLDDTFGDYVSGTSGPRRGYAVHDSAAGGGFEDIGSAVAVDGSDNSIVITGRSDGIVGNLDMALWRFTADGVLDSAFNGVGYLSHNSAAGGNYIDMGNAVAIDSSGRIVVAGASIGPIDFDMVIWRYDPTGTLDTTFGDFESGNAGPKKGFAVHGNTAGGNDDDVGVGMVLDSTGRIVVTGYSYNTDGDMDMVIWRFLP